MGPKTKSVNRALAKMITLDMRTFTSIERQGFKELVKILDPKARLPSRNHILASTTTCIGQLGLAATIQQEQQSTLIKLFKKNEEYNQMGPKTKSVKRALAKMIAIDMRTFTSIERQGFKELVKILDPKARLPSRDHILEKYLVPLSNITADKLPDSMLHAEAHAFTRCLYHR